MIYYIYVNLDLNIQCLPIQHTLLQQSITGDHLETKIKAFLLWPIPLRAQHRGYCGKQEWSFQPKRCARLEAWNSIRLEWL